MTTFKVLVEPFGVRRAWDNEEVLFRVCSRGGKPVIQWQSRGVWFDHANDGAIRIALALYSAMTKSDGETP